jgi:serine/threonine protein kinase
MARAAPLAPDDPAFLGAYELVGRLGSGGQGVVYLGRTSAGQNVAIKLLHARMSADRVARSRLAREVAAARQVAAFCTARVLDADLDGPRPYVVSEFIEGPSLYDVVARDGPYTGPALERLAIGIATALAAIHRHGVVHRDLKPANVLIGSDGPRVVDFGLARPSRDEMGRGVEPVTVTGAVVGTPGYLAPEQLDGAPPTPAFDIFAWGVTIAFAATGRLPFEAQSIPPTTDRLRHGAPDLHGMTGTTRELVAEALAKDPAQRPSADEILLRLLGHGRSPRTGPGDLLDRGSRLAAMLPAPSLPSPSAQDRTGSPWAVPVLLTPRSGPSSGSTRSSGWAVMATVGVLLVLMLVPGGYFAAKSALFAFDSTVPPPASSPQPAGPPQTPAQADVIPADYAGTWTGTGYQRDGSTWRVVISLTAGTRTGWVSYPGFPCSGRLELGEVRKDEIEFTEEITKGRAKCIVQGIVVLARKGRGMDFVYRTHPGQRPAEASARLLKRV